MPHDMNRTHPFSFPKSERLCSKRAIEALFAAGHKSLAAFPVRAVFTFTDKEPKTPPSALLISVSKHKIKKAVSRNRVKRQVREAYRKNKLILWQALQGADKHANLAFIWLADNLLPSYKVEASVKLLLRRIAEQIPPKTNNSPRETPL